MQCYIPSLDVVIVRLWFVDYCFLEFVLGIFGRCHLVSWDPEGGSREAHVFGRSGTDAIAIAKLLANASAT